MKRLFCLFFSIALIVATLSAATVTPAVARRLAASFLAARGGALGRTSSSEVGNDMLSETESVSPNLYIFNIGSGDGFIIVSGDDRTEAILGYSEQGMFDAATLPDNTRAWLDGYSKTIAALKESTEIATDDDSDSNDNASLEPVRPLLTTQWAQLKPYNLLCKNKAAGCVATAMAQIMKYYEWPKGETTSIPAYGSYEELPPTTFEWNKMLASYGDDESEETIHAVALLTQYCGRAVQMDYGSVSSAFSESIPKAMNRYFNYDRSLRCVYRSDYSVAEWEALLYSELSAGRPIIYGGSRSGGGHEFVCDGYDGQGFYHINWGWGGYSDGWYRLSYLFPPILGTGAGSGLDAYSMDQSVVIGVQPDRGGTAPLLAPLLTAEEMRLLSATVVERGSIDESFELGVRCTMSNHSADTLKSGFGLALMKDGQLVEGSELLYGLQTFSPGSHINRNFVHTYTFGNGLTGVYRIVPVCHVKHGETTELHVAQGADTYYMDVVLTETMLTLTEHPVRNLEVSDVQFRLIDGTIEATACVTNRGDNYNGLLYLSVEGGIKTYVGVVLDAGASDLVTFRYRRVWTVQDYKIGYSAGDTEWLAEGSADYITDNTQGMFTVWYADGQSELVPFSEDGAVIVPSKAVAVDIGSNMPSTIVPNGNPNCLYYTVYNIMAVRKLPNVVINRFCNELTLTDGHAFYCPMAFTAGNVAYTRTFAGGYDGKGGGWDTIILPFDVQTVTPEGRGPIDWFHSAEDADKEFWLMTFEGSNGAKLTFGHAQQMEANRPYLIAVPSDVYGDRSLQGSRVTFAADHAVVHETALTADNASGYSFVGSFGQYGLSGLVGQEALAQWWLLNETGSRFKGSLRRAAPFRVFLRVQ